MGGPLDLLTEGELLPYLTPTPPHPQLTPSKLCFRQPPDFHFPFTYPRPPGIMGKAITSGLSFSLILIKDSGHRVFA